MYIRSYVANCVHSYVPYSLKGRKILPVSNGLTERDKSDTMTITSSSEVPYAVMSTKALSEETFIEPLPHYDYAALGARKVRICVSYSTYVCTYVTTVPN